MDRPDSNRQPSRISQAAHTATTAGSAHQNVQPSYTAVAHVSNVSKRPISSSISSHTDDTRYIVFMRLPFARNGFVDPPPVDWDASKERSLWRTMSRSSRNSDLDCVISLVSIMKFGANAIIRECFVSLIQSKKDQGHILIFKSSRAEHYGVSVPFLLQQAAWLYERELSQVRAQLRRVGTANASGTATPPLSGPPTNVRLSDLRTPSAASIRPTSVGMTPATPRGQIVHTSPPLVGKGSPLVGGDPMSKTASSGPVKRQTPLAPPLTTTTPHKSDKQETVKDALVTEQLSKTPVNVSPTTIRRSSSSSSTSSTVSSTDSPLQTRSRLIRKRRPLGRGTQEGSAFAFGRNSEEDGEEESPAFLPWIEGGEAEEASTVTESAPVRRSRQANFNSAPQDKEEQGFHDLPRSNHRQQLAQVDSGNSTPESHPNSSPRRRQRGEGKKLPGENESSPSMGSSFSDLSDTSLTQSALEEQYMSAVGNGAMASRMSTISQAVRSRYFP